MGLVEFGTLAALILKAVGFLDEFTWFQIFIPEIICCVAYVLILVAYVGFMCWISGCFKKRKD